MQSTTAIATWAEAFPFSEDLEALEQIYQQQHQQSLVQSQGSGMKPLEVGAGAVPGAGLTSDEPTLDQLAMSIANRISGFLAEPDVIAHTLKLHELEQDNRLMAQHIQDLLGRTRALSLENKMLRHQLRLT